MNDGFSEWFLKYLSKGISQTTSMYDLMLDAYLAGKKSNIDTCLTCGQTIVYDGSKWFHATRPHHTIGKSKV